MVTSFALVEEEGEYFGLEESSEIHDVLDNSDVKLAKNTYDKYIGVEVSLPDRKGINLMAKVMIKIISNDQNSTSSAYNPLAYHSSYEVQFSYGTTEYFTSNVIAENMLSGCDSKGNHF